MTRWSNDQPCTEQEFIEEQIEDHLARLFTAMPARVQRYDATLQVCDLVPLVRHPRKDPDGGYTHEDYPVLPCVPVVFPRTGDHFIAFALQPGDMGLVVFCKEAIGHWRVGNGDVTDPGDLRRQHLAHAVAIPGLYTRGRALRQTGAAGATTPEGLPTGVVLGSDETTGPRLLIKADGSIEIVAGGTVAAHVDADGTVHLGAASGAAFVALASLVGAQLEALKNAISGAAVVPNDGGAAFKANLMTALASWPASVAATRAKAT